MLANDNFQPLRFLKCMPEPLESGKTRFNGVHDLYHLTLNVSYQYFAVVNILLPIISIYYFSSSVLKMGH